MALGRPLEILLADWEDDTFTTSPPPDVAAATDADLEELDAADPWDLVEEPRPENLVIPTDNHIDDLEAAGIYSDESHKLYVGKAFGLEQFRQWWDAQTFGSLPFNGVGIHHTAIPDRNSWIGLQHLANTFSYYKNELGWPAGKGPHLWLRSSRPGKVKGPVVYVGTHPASDGIGISYRNMRYLHIEFIDRFDAYGMSAEDYYLYRYVLRIACGERGIPLKHVDGTGWDNPSKPMPGYLFHRRAKTNIKSCPGSKVAEGPFGDQMRAAPGKPAPGPLIPRPANEAPHRTRKYNLCSNPREPEHARMAQAFAGAINAASKKDLATAEADAPNEVRYVTRLSSEAKFGELVSILVGEPVTHDVSPAVSLLGKPEETDTWSTSKAHPGVPSDYALERFAGVVEGREKLPKGSVLKEFRKGYPPKAPAR